MGVDMAPRVLYEGQCVGGPMDGMAGQSRFSKGFVLVHKEDQEVYVYDAVEDVFKARKADALDDQKIAKAAAESKYDVRAYDAETMGEWK
jgi:hypothetical protein